MPPVQYTSTFYNQSPQHHVVNPYNMLKPPSFINPPPNNHGFPFGPGTPTY
jgi:hypothetical protein